MKILQIKAGNMSTIKWILYFLLNDLRFYSYLG